MQTENFTIIMQDDSDGEELESIEGNKLENVLVALKAKQRASILWLLSKACNSDIPSELKEPYYKDHDGEDRLKPQIVHALANSELYCLVLANIYADPNYNHLNHNGIIQVLMRKGIYVTEPHDTSLTETVLVQTAPIKMSAHMVIIEALMALYIKEVLIPEKVVDVVNRFMPVDPEEEVPDEAEDAALFWINKCCLKFKERIAEELAMEREDEAEHRLPPLPALEYLWDLSDGCSLAALLSFYCPEDLSWREICNNEPMSLADSAYNLQLVQFFCQEKLPCDIFFLSVEDFLDCHRVIRPNVLAFVADLLYHFEIRPAPCVRSPTADNGFRLFQDEEMGVNGSALKEPDLPTPAEMKAMSLQHTGWPTTGKAGAESGSGPRSISTPSRRVGGGSAPAAHLAASSSSTRGYHRSASHDAEEEEDDEELTRYFSALDLKPDLDSSPELMMGRDGPISMHPHSSGNSHSYSRRKQLAANYVRESPDRRSRAAGDDGTPTHSSLRKENGIELNSSSPARNAKMSGSNSHLADYFSHLNEQPQQPPTLSRSNSKTTSFVKLSRSRELIPKNEWKVSSNENSYLPDHSISPAVSIGFSHLDRHESRRDHSSRDSASGSPAMQRQLSPTSRSTQAALFQLNNSMSIRECLEQEQAEAYSPAKQRAQHAPVMEPSEDGPVDNQVAAQVYNIRMQLEEKRKKIEQKRVEMQEALKNQRQDIGKEAFLRVVKRPKEDSSSASGRESYMEDSLSSGDGVLSIPPTNYWKNNLPLHTNDSPNGHTKERNTPNATFASPNSSNFQRTPKSFENVPTASKEAADDRGFFVAFDDDERPKPRAPPVLRSRQPKKEPTRTDTVVVGRKVEETYSGRHGESPRRNNVAGDTSAERRAANNSSVHSPRPTTPGVGFIIGADMVHLDPDSEQSMNKKKEMMLIQSVKRRAEAEAKRIEKQEELARKREEERIKREDQERKREEEKTRKQQILETYRLRKLQEEEEKLGQGNGSSFLSSSKDSSRNSGTVVLHRPSRALRPNSAGNAPKPRPKSLHVNASFMSDYTSLDPRSSRLRDTVDSSFGHHLGNGASIMGSAHHELASHALPPSTSSSRPQSALSASSRRMPSPPSSSSLASRQPALPSLPPPHMFFRHRGPPSDGASDAGSTFSEYSGPKLFVKPASKSNRGIILNAINTVLAGSVNSDTKKKVLEEIGNSESKHFLILFRGAGLQFRAIYSYSPDRDDVIKLHGTGPKVIFSDMIDKFYKYNSGSKNFNLIQTKHLTVTIDAFTIHNTLWAGKRPATAAASASAS